MISLYYMWTQKKKTKQQTQRYSEYTGGYQKRWEVGEIGEGG